MAMAVGGGGASVREEVAMHVHEHRFLVTKLLESLNTALLCVTRLYTTLKASIACI